MKTTNKTTKDKMVILLKGLYNVVLHKEKQKCFTTCNKLKKLLIYNNFLTFNKLVILWEKELKKKSKFESKVWTKTANQNHWLLSYSNILFSIYHKINNSTALLCVYLAFVQTNNNINVKVTIRNVHVAVWVRQESKCPHFYIKIK